MEILEVSNLNLDIKQINNLCTGVKLATELKASKFNLRRFLTVHGYRYNDTGKRIKLGKTLNVSNIENIYFELRCYEICIDYYINNWDVTDDDLVNDIYLDDIKGVKLLEFELKKYIQDFSVLQPEWYCDNLL